MNKKRGRNKMQNKQYAKQQRKDGFWRAYELVLTKFYDGDNN